MPSSSRRSSALGLGVTLSLALYATQAHAQQAYQGFALDRFYASAPGAGWFAMDALDMSHDKVGGVISLSTEYARNPLRISDATNSITAVSDQAVTDIGFALTLDRLRLSVNFGTPVLVTGQTGTVGGYTVSDPAVNLGSAPDTLTDAGVGMDARLLGGPASPFRLGAGATVYIPTGNGAQAAYVSDGAVRGMFRIDTAGDAGPFCYAGYVGLHLRALDDGEPGSPRGQELIFGAAAGVKFRLTHAGPLIAVIGPEVFGASALRAVFGSQTTELEGLLGARVESGAPSGLAWRLKLGGGLGLYQQFGAPDWRVLFGIEVFNRDARRSFAPPNT